eukprot:TRINITY_DN24947_c0_g1_i1.p1 TRINITY_DN24947_c0_g1~~TRINITY_DN24947_c0_g1_i1.p1  ORF type:complete len:129 (+),score=29.16 TRINITY_DN24947_c0_g1_i1:120-506(+)
MPILDESIFSQLLACCEDEGLDFVKDIVEMFFEQVEEKFPSMQADLKTDTKDSLMEFSRSAHFLKGSAAGIGCTAVQDHCQDLQVAGEGNDGATCKVVFEKLMASYQITKAHLEKILSGEYKEADYYK